MPAVDRIRLAATLATNARVLDIGGQKMEGCDPNSPFAIEYARIEQASSDYRIVDYQQQPTVDYVVDLNEAAAIPAVRSAIEDLRPEAILCMETLEHVNYSFELMNEMARAVAEFGTIVFITLPNNRNWIFNALGWNRDHSTAFFRDIAYRFVTRSRLGEHDVLVAPCMQKYLWYWRLVYTLSLFQPLSWGFLVIPKDYQPSETLQRTVTSLRAFTSANF